MVGLKIHESKTHFLHIPQSYSLALSIPAETHSEPKGSAAWQAFMLFGPLNELNNCQEILPGTAAILMYNKRFIYFLINKQNYKHCTSYDTCQVALICLREHMRKYGITKVALVAFAIEDRSDLTLRDLLEDVFCHEKHVEIMLCSEQQEILDFKPKCNVLDVQGNVFSAPKNFSLVHTVSADFAMCAGINLQFKCKFGRLDELRSQHKHTGSVAVLKENERFIYNLVVKERSHEKASYASLYYALVAMREHMLQNGVSNLAIPHLGCGIDRLSWRRVRNIIEMVFYNEDMTIVAYFYGERSQSNLRISPSVTCSQCQHPV